MFERFTEPARRAVTLAQQEARDLGHDYIGAEHLLLGLLAHDPDATDTAVTVLESFHVDVASARLQVELIVGRGLRSPNGHIPFTPRAKKTLELSLKEALRLGYNYIGTEHLLLGLLDDPESVACQVLTALDVRRDELGEALLAGMPSAEAPVSPADGWFHPAEDSASREWTPPRLRPYRDWMLRWVEPGWRIVYRYNRPLIALGFVGAVPVLLWISRQLSSIEHRLAHLESINRGNRHR